MGCRAKTFGTKNCARGRQASREMPSGWELRGREGGRGKVSLCEADVPNGEEPWEKRIKKGRKG